MPAHRLVASLQTQCPACEVRAVDEAAWHANLAINFAQLLGSGDSKLEEAGVEAIRTYLEDTKGLGTVGSVNLIGYSGGGNIAIDVARKMEGVQIDNIITLGTPRVILPGSEATLPQNVGKLSIAFSFGDGVQNTVDFLGCMAPTTCATLGRTERIELQRFPGMTHSAFDPHWYQSAEVAEWIIEVIRR